MRRKKSGWQAREIVMLSVMTALCVTANVICSHTIPVHGGTAVVILSGISLGGLPGLVVGALGRLISNFFDGQGPWTPWQMLSWALIGGISGICFQPVKRKTLLERRRKKKMTKKEQVELFLESITILLGIVIMEVLALLEAYVTTGNIKHIYGWRFYAYGFVGLIIGCIIKKKRLTANRLIMSIYSFLIVFIIYGGIMNSATLLMQNMLDGGQNPLNVKTLVALYITGVPYDLSHACGVAVCVFIFGESLLQKLERIQIKYNVFPKETKARNVQKER